MLVTIIKEKFNLECLCLQQMQRHPSDIFSFCSTSSILITKPETTESKGNIFLHFHELWNKARVQKRLYIKAVFL